MYTIRKLKTLLVLWSLVLAGTVIVHLNTLVKNNYIENNLFVCAVSNYLADVHWNSFLFATATVYVALAAFSLRFFVKDSNRRLSISLRSCLCLFFLYIVLVYINSRVWFPEPYTAKGILYNLLMLLLIFGVGVFTPVPLRSVSSFIKRVKPAIPVSIVVVLYMVPLLYHSQARSKHEYNVLLITCDTLRVGNLSMNGYQRKTSVNIDSFAEQCLNFTRTYSQSSFTPPSHASMFTSRIVSNHKLYSWDELDDAAVTMAEVFANEGFRTAAFVNMSLLSEQNLGQGFQTKVESFFNMKNCLSERLIYNRDTEYNNFFTGHEINEMFQRWLKGDNDAPFFVWLHYWDVHRPFAQDEKYELIFSDHKFSSRTIGRELSHYNLREKNIKNLKFTEADLRYLHDRYDAGVYTFDLMFRDLLSKLKEMDLYDNTLIVLTSDHGESLMERDEMYYTHDPYLYDEVIHVPLMLKLPGEEKRFDLEEPVMLIDLLPTLLDFLGMKDSYGIESDGRVLDLSNPAGIPDFKRDIVSECFGWRKKRAVIKDGIKYIYDFQKNEYEIYNLTVDSAETTNIKHNNISLNIEQIMNSYNNDITGAVKEIEMDAEQLERLKALGYIDQ